MADTTTAVPAGLGNFSDFIVPGNVGPSLNHGAVSFMGLGPNGQAGIYTNLGGRLRAVADTTTPIPGGGGTFVNFSAASLDDGNILFRGFGADGQHGLYRAGTNGLTTVADINTPRLGVVRELSFRTTKPIGVAIPGRKGRFAGDRFVILATNATRNPSAQTRIQMFAANTGPLRIVSESTDPAPRRLAPNRCVNRASCIFSGFPNKAIGDAQVFLTRNKGRQILQVDNIGSDLSDGVLQDVPGTMDMSTALATPNFSRSKPGAQLVTTQIGVVGDKRNALFSKMTIVNEKGHLKVTGDWSLIGTTSYEIRVYHGSKLVTAQRGLSDGALEMLGLPDISVMRCHIWVIIVISADYSMDTATSASAPRISFCAVDNSGAVREYTQDTRGRIRLLADENTPIPDGTGTFTSFDVFGTVNNGTVAISGRGRRGQAGIYWTVRGHLRVVADTSTRIPGGRGTFAVTKITGVPMPGAFGGLSLDRGNIAFSGHGRDGQVGIYAKIGGRLQLVADTSTTAPGGGGKFINFEHFAGPALNAKTVAFVGLTKKLSGLYLWSGGKRRRIIATGDKLDGKTVFWVLLSPRSLERDRVAFYVTFKDGSHGIYIARV